MNQKTKTLIAIGAAIILIAAIAVYLQKNKKQNGAQLLPQQNSAPQEEQAVQLPTLTTLEGPVIALTDKEIAIGNNTPEPTLFKISAKTPVFKLDKDEQEIESGLADLQSNTNTKVFFDTKEEGKTKTAVKIWILEK